VAALAAAVVGVSVLRAGAPSAPNGTMTEKTRRASAETVEKLG
jgi:hypothetical protein